MFVGPNSLGLNGCCCPAWPKASTVPASHRPCAWYIDRPAGQVLQLSHCNLCSLSPSELGPGHRPCASFTTPPATFPPQRHHRPIILASAQPACPAVDKMPLRSLVGGAIGCLNSLPHLTQQQPKQRQQRHEHFRDLPRYDDLASAASCSHSSWSECDGHCRTSDHSHADHPPLWAAHTGGARGGLPPHRPCDSVDQLPSYAESTFEATEALDLVWSKYTLGSKIAVHVRLCALSLSLSLPRRTRRFSAPRCTSC